MDGIPPDYFDVTLAVRHALALEPEGSPLSWCVQSDDVPPSHGNWTVDANAIDRIPFLAANAMGWGEFWEYEHVPAASTAKWLEARHMVHIVDRWATSHILDLQSAYLSGNGFVAWENVWGIYLGISDRDAEAIRRMASIERAFGWSHLHSEEWTPFTASPIGECSSDVFVTAFPISGNGTVYLIANVGENDFTNCTLSISYSPDDLIVDVYHGVTLSVESRHRVQISIDNFDFGCLYVTNAPLSPDLVKLMSQMSTMTSSPLSSYSADTYTLLQTLDDADRVSRIRSPITPMGMVEISGVENYQFVTVGLEVEGGEIGVDVQYPWETVPQRHHNTSLSIVRFFMDQYLVTTHDYHEYLLRSNFTPRDAHNFLLNWNWSAGQYPPEPFPSQEDIPVSWISYEEARAYCASQGKRLPFEWEWQYAAQGTDGRTYPWGEDWVDENVPPPQYTRTMSPLSSIFGYPGGASPFGVENMIGYCWQLTDRYRDTHTAAAVVVGGSPYYPQGSSWCACAVRMLCACFVACVCVFFVCMC